MVRIASRQAVVIDEYPQLALAKGRTVEVRQVVDGGTRGVHGRLINQMNLAEERRVAGELVIQSGQVSEKRHPRRPMLLGDGSYRGGKLIDCVGTWFEPITIQQAKVANL